MNEIIRRRLRVRGIVQGVGFRPFVFGLANRLKLAGHVGNDPAGVFIELQGSPPAVERFLALLVAHPPAQARITAVEVENLPPVAGASAFVIEESRAAPLAGEPRNRQETTPVRTLVSPDLAICDQCAREIADPADRHYRYPFTNCTHCGPRYTIIQALPYDRRQTTLAGFALCPACRAEYEDPANRRFHAQPVACPSCGPRLYWHPVRRERHAGNGADAVAERAQVTEGEAALAAAQRVLAGGGIVAVKGIGGFHLVCDAGSEAAVRRLRLRKQRNAKPFAIMAPTLAAAEQVAEIQPAACTLLLGRERPIVILPQRPGSGLAPAVAPGSQTVGVMLPYAPLHLLLFDGLQLSGPPLLVFTSANLAEAPIEFEDEPALQRLAELVDGFLLHDRPIAINCDDSVWQMAGAEPQLLRRSRGYTPLPLPLPAPAPPLLATGSDLKNVIGVGSGDEVFLSQHIGDLAHPAALALAQRTAAQLQRLFQIEPALIVCDSHPGYHGSRWAEGLAQNKQLLRVQHHHAHAAALMAEHGVPPGEAILAFVWDGTGYGDDGAIWGGEALRCTYATCTRVAHLRYVPLPGGDAAIRKPYRAALAHLHSAGIEWAGAALCMAPISPQEAHLLARQLVTGYNCVPTSSMGRLIDAVAALCGVAAVVSYEAQAAIELEAQIPPTLQPRPGAVAPYPFPLLPGAGGPAQWDPEPLLRALLADLQAGVGTGIIAARTLAGLAHGLLAVAEQQRRLFPGQRIGISGGVFQNRWLTQYVSALLEQAGFVLLRHRLVPANDGAIAYGQAAIASVVAPPVAKFAGV